MCWSTLAAVVGGLVVLWLTLVVVLWRAQRHNPRATNVRDVLRLVPDVIRLLRRLTGDRTLLRGVRFRLWLLLIYLISPIDLIPDFIPVLGYADDAIIVAVALRVTSRSAGPDALRRHWPGTPARLAAVLALARLEPDRRAGDMPGATVRAITYPVAAQVLCASR